MKDKEKKNTNKIKSKKLKQNKIKKLNKQEAEQIRNNRLPTVITIIAAMVGVCAGVLNFSKRFANVYSQGDIISSSLFVLCVAAASAIIWLIIDTLIYVFVDLSRLNIFDNKIKDCDNKSDYYYNILIRDFKFYFCVIVYMFLFVISLLYMSEGGLGIIFGSVIIVFLIFVSIYGVIYIIDNKINIILWIGLVLLCALCIFLLIDTRESKVEIQFKDEKISISNTTIYEFKSLSIVIYDENNNKVYSKQIDDEELLRAGINCYVIDDYEKYDFGSKDGLVFDAQERSWRYNFDMKAVCMIDNIDTIDERYNIIITIVDENEKIQLWNEVYIKNGNYEYAKNYIEKVY